jgi:hypothetical protein
MVESRGFAVAGLIGVLLFAVLFYYIFNRDSGKKYPPGIIVESVPEQINFEAKKVLDHKGYTVVAKASFKGSARVLSRKRYWFDRGAKLVPVDLALGWMEMSDQSVIDELKISQRTRFFYWKTNGNSFPVPREKIEHNSANMHMIPSNKEIEKTLKSISKSDIISFEGYLVDVSRKEGDFTWNSSMTRTDTGGGACEVVYLTALNIVYVQ